MRKFLLPFIALATFFTGATAVSEVALPNAAPAVQEVEEAEAQAQTVYCKRNIMVDGRFRGSCVKYVSTVYYHRVRVVCNNGLYDVAHDGPAKLTLWTPSDNWSYSFGCSPGEQFKYYTVLVWRG